MPRARLNDSIGCVCRKILHLLSQRPDSTGSGIYVQAMIREATACGDDNYLVAGYTIWRLKKLLLPVPVMTRICFIQTQSQISIRCS
jgi:hypothetical protein